MSVKPSFGDASLWIAVAVAAVVAFLVARQGLAYRMEAAPAPE
jgi:beta-lactamase regulating signal transducer with metallopeptidase domain